MNWINLNTKYPNAFREWATKVDPNFNGEVVQPPENEPELEEMAFLVVQKHFDSIGIYIDPQMSRVGKYFILSVFTRVGMGGDWWLSENGLGEYEWVLWGTPSYNNGVKFSSRVIAISVGIEKAMQIREQQIIQDAEWEKPKFSF